MSINYLKTHAIILISKMFHLTLVSYWLVNDDSVLVVFWCQSNKCISTRL